MRLRGSAFVLSVLIMATGVAHAGGSVGGGSGLALDLWKQLVTQKEFQRLVTSGLKGETAEFQSRSVAVRAVDFESRTMEIETEEEGQSVIIHLIEEAE